MTATPAATVVAPVDPLICGSVENGGLLKSEKDAFDRELAELRNHPSSNKAALWGPSPLKPAELVFNLPWRSYPLVGISFVPFNGCSANVMQNFALVNCVVDGINRKNHPYDIKGAPTLSGVDVEKFREYVLYSLFRIAPVAPPLFLNLPPAGALYASARKFLAKHKAEVACQFVNPNYPERAATQDYTTLYVFDQRSWLSPGNPKFFQGLIK